MSRTRRPLSPVDSQRWMVTFSDLVTLLLTFFVLTLSMSAMDGGQIQRAFGRSDSAQEGVGGTALVNLAPPKEHRHPGLGGGDEQQRDELNALEEGVGEEIGNLGLDAAVDVRSEGRGVVLTLPGDILFGSGEAKISAAGREVLRDLIPVVSRRSVLVSVEGHTDATVSRSWTYRDNWDLSIARAAAVARILEEAGVNPATLSVTGYGSSRPRAVGRPEDVGHLNRRVELVLRLENKVADIYVD